MTILRTRLLKVTIVCVAGLLCAGCSVEARKAQHLERAEHYFAAGELDKAKIEYLNTLRVDFRNPTAIARLGIIWCKQGAPLRAYPYLYMARDLDPNNLEARTKLMTVLAFLEETGAAKQEASAILDQSPAEEEAVMFLADDAATEEEAEDVRERLRSLPEGQDALYHLAWARLALRNGEIEYARNELDQALKLEPRSPRVHLARASFHAAQEKLSEAEAEFETAAELAGGDAGIRFDYARLEKESGATEKARTMLEEITKQTPDFLPAWRLLAQIAFERGQHEEAAALLERIFQRDFANFEGRMLQADNWLAQGESKQALDWLERLDVAYENVPLIKYQLARAHVRNNDPSQAIIALEQALAIEPGYVEAVLLLGELHLRAGDAPRVLGAMTKLLKSHPDLVSAQRLLVESLRSLGRWQDAATVLEKQIEASPESAGGYFQLGLILREGGRPNEARKMFARALELAPGDLSTLDQLVELDLTEQNFQAAAERVQQQLREAPSSACAYLLQGKIYFSEKRWDQAEAAFLRALELDVNLPGAYGGLVSTYVAANKVPQA
ncbi:MAG TPA: tetratricopeptide repeat protein, partial [Chthoniobacterales bacterium]